MLFNHRTAPLTEVARTFRKRGSTMTHCSVAFDHHPEYHGQTGIQTMNRWQFAAN
jgi:hypothetical protein